MLSLKNIKASSWARKKFKRLWRWNGSGKWTFCWRWMNGQNCRSWWGVPDWFEWGQTPLFRRMPKLKGFSNARFKKEYNIINIKDVNILIEKWINTINKEILLENKIIRKKRLWVKLLWNWKLEKPVTINVDKNSASAKEAIEKAWGKLEICSSISK